MLYPSHIPKILQMPEDFDAGLQTQDATDAMLAYDADVDTFVVTVPKAVDCNEFDPNDPASREIFGLTEETAQDVQLILSGQDCRPIFMSPALTEECDVDGPIPVESTLQFEGTLLFLARSKGYNLKDGEMLYKAVKGACGSFPDAQVKAVGLKFKAIGLSDAEIQVKLENGQYGDILARVHVWTGEGAVETIEGEEVIRLLANQQALVASDGQVQEVIEFDPNRSGEPAISSNEEKNVGVPHKGDKGCHTTPALPTGIDPIMAAVLLLLVARGTRGKVKKLLG